MKILIATNNEYKRKQFKYLLQSFPVEVLTLKDLSLTGEVVEDGITARDNAAIKAKYWGAKAQMVTLGDDAGLEIDALDKKPGVKARRWGGFFNDKVGDEEWLAHLLKQLEGVPFEKRTACYRAAWVVVAPDGRELSKDIILDFKITEEPQRPYPPGSPMSAVRYFEEYQKIETELSPEEQWQKLLQEMEGWREFRELLEENS